MHLASRMTLQHIRCTRAHVVHHANCDAQIGDVMTMAMCGVHSIHTENRHDGKHNNHQRRC